MALFSLGQLASGERMQYARPSGQSAFLQGMQEAQAVGDLWRKNQLEQTQLNRMETGRGMALGALMNPNDPNAKTQFAQGIAEQGDLKGAQQMIWPNQGSGLSTEERALNRFAAYKKDIDDQVAAKLILEEGIAKLQPLANDILLTPETPEGSSVMRKITNTMNQYMRQMSGAAVTESEATRLLMALGLEGLSSYVGGVVSGTDLASIIAEDMRKGANAKIKFNPAAVYNALADIANGIQTNIFKKVESYKTTDPTAYEKLASYAYSGQTKPVALVPETMQGTRISQTSIDETEHQQRMGKAEGRNELEKQLEIARSEELADLVARNEGIKAAVVAGEVLPYQKMLAQYTSNLGINANAEGIRQASQEVRDKVALAQAALKRGGPNAAAEAQQHLAGTGFSIKDIAVPALTAEKIKRTKSASQYQAPAGKKKEKPPIKKGEKGVTGKIQ